MKLTGPHPRHFRVLQCVGWVALIAATAVAGARPAAGQREDSLAQQVVDKRPRDGQARIQTITAKAESSDPMYQKDINTADILLTRDEASESDFQGCRISEQVRRQQREMIARDLARLRQHWAAQGRGEEFDRDVKRRHLTLNVYPRKTPCPGQRALPATIPSRPPPSAGGGSSLGWLTLLLVPIGGVGYFVLRRRRAGTSANPDYVPVPTPQVSDGPQAPSRSPVAAPPSTPAGENRSLKERMLAEQQAKYQARYNDAQDEMTAASVELAQVAGVLDGVRVNLATLSKVVRDRVHALAEARHARPSSLMIGALTFLPVVRLFRRGGLVVRGIVIVVGLCLLSAAVATLVDGDLLAVLAIYLVLATVSLFVERRFQLKEARSVLNAGHEPLRALTITHVYEDQAPHLASGTPSDYAIRVAAAGGQVEEVVLAANTWGGLTSGSFYVAAGSMATYRIDVAGGATRAAGAADDKFMKWYGELLDEAVRSQRAFGTTTLPGLAVYGRVAWRRRRAAEALPQLERLMSEISHLEQCWADTYVSDEVFEFLIRRIDLFSVRDPATPPGILLHGYPGNGKAYLARKIAESVGARLDTVDAATLTSPDAVRKVWTKARGNDPVVLFVDYAERVFPRPGSHNEGSGTREATLAWLAEWEQHEAYHGQVWVVLTAEAEQELHPAIVSRLGGSRIEVAAPAAPGREVILRQVCRQNHVPGELPTWLVSRTGAATIQELRKIVQETKLLSAPDVPQEAHWREAVKNVRGAEAEFKDENKTWDRLVLPAAIKQQLQRACRILGEPDGYKVRGVNLPNILLFGPPGTGKTDIARTFANEGGVKFMLATTADLKAEYVGQSAPKVRSVFAKARALAPAILFIDEIETIAAKRGSTLGDSFTQEIVTEMLQQMDGARKQDRPVLVLAATNRPEDIDPAIISRFTSKIEIPLPDEASRREMLHRLIAERPVDPALDVEAASTLLARRLPRKSGRDLVMLVNRAMERAVMAADSPDDVRLTHELLVAEVAPAGREVVEADLQKAWSQIVLKPDVKESLLAKIRLFNAGDKAAPRGLLLYGPPGTGKTEIARRIAESTSSHFMALTGSDLKAGYVGQSGQYVRRVWEEARSRGRCIMFVDECEGVFARRGSVATDAASEELVREFLALWDGVASDGQVWVVGATNRRDQLDEAIVSRFGAAVEIGLPEAAERLAIVRLELSKLEREAEVPESVPRLTTGMAGRDLARVVRDVCTLAAERGGGITPNLWEVVLARSVKAASDAGGDDASWDSLVLPERTIETLKAICATLRHAETLRKQGVDPPTGALLFGPPGTGKTQIARTLARESGLPFLVAGTADLKAGFVGQSGQKVRELFERARGKAPCILFIDEIESAVPSRGSSSADQFTSEIVTQMLQELDGVKKSDRPVFVLAATNHPGQVDAAILSRFEEKIEIPNPDRAQRTRIFHLFFARQPALDFDADAMAADLADRCGEISGRDIRSLVRRAQQHAVQRAIRAGTTDRVVLSRDDLLAIIAAAPAGGTGGETRA